jgi:hypothetical protein
MPQEPGGYSFLFEYVQGWKTLLAPGPYLPGRFAQRSERRASACEAVVEMCTRETAGVLGGVSDRRDLLGAFLRLGSRVMLEMSCRCSRHHRMFPRYSPCGHLSFGSRVDIRALELEFEFHPERSGIHFGRTRPAHLAEETLGEVEADHPPTRAARCFGIRPSRRELGRSPRTMALFDEGR